MTSDATARTAAHRFVSLTTFRRTGVAVATPVWVVGDGDALLVLTPADSGKAKRLRNDPRVELRPCSRRGAVADGAEQVTGTAEVLDDAALVERLHRLLRAKYGLEVPVVMLVERLVARGQKPRVALRVTLSR